MFVLLIWNKSGSYEFWPYEAPVVGEVELSITKLSRKVHRNEFLVENVKHQHLTLWI